MEEAGNHVIFVELAERAFDFRASEAEYGKGHRVAETTAGRKIALD